MEDVRPVAMYHHPGFGIALSVAIAAHMAAAVDDADLMTGFGKTATDHCTGQAGADEEDLHESDVPLGV